MIDARPIDEMSDVTGKQFLSTLYEAQRPIVMRGLASHWPIVQAAGDSDRSVIDYLGALGGNRPMKAMRGPVERNGLFFYGETPNTLNFTEETGGFIDHLEKMLDDTADRTRYIQSIPTPDLLPNFMEDNPSTILTPKIIPRIWIGGLSTVQTHFDLSQNIAVVAAGQRRFTLFPPQQTANLYMGPMEFTPAGTPVSLVPLDQVNLERFPKFETAMKTAQSAVLEPGDGIFIPYMWWHHVQAMGRFNVLVNYWWNEYDGLGSPLDTMLHAILTLRDLPPPMRDAWQSFFEAFIFAGAEDASSHIPNDQRGGLGPLTPSMRGQLWSALKNGVEQTSQTIADVSKH